MKLESVTFGWQRKPYLLENIDFELVGGQFVVLLGANGSGKSTLAKLMAGILKPASGRISGRRDGPWNGVGMVLQEPASQLVTGRIDREIAWGLENLRIPESEMRKRVDEVLEEFGLSLLRSSPPETLSDGQAQLLAMASVCAMEPDTLIFDEAGSLLDRDFRKRVYESARVRSEKHGVLWIASRMEAMYGGAEIWRLAEGKLFRVE